MPKSILFPNSIVNNAALSKGEEYDLTVFSDTNILAASSNLTAIYKYKSVDNIYTPINAYVQDPLSDPGTQVNGLSFCIKFKLMPMKIIICCISFILVLSLMRITLWFRGCLWDIRRRQHWW